jgi:hypothetical protein
MFSSTKRQVGPAQHTYSLNLIGDQIVRCTQLSEVVAPNEELFFITTVDLETETRKRQEIPDVKLQASRKDTACGCIMAVLTIKEVVDVVTRLAIW